MNNRIQGLLAAMTIAACTSVTATGLATCDSGPKSGWQPIEKLEKQLTERGWAVRRVKEDVGGLSRPDVCRRCSACASSSEGRRLVIGIHFLHVQYSAECLHNMLAVCDSQSLQTA